MSLASLVSDALVELANAIKTRGFPRGGTVGQVVAKTSGNDFEFGWQNPAGGGGGLTYGSAVIDFGAVPTSELYIVIGAPGCTVASKIDVWVDFTTLLSLEETSDYQLASAFTKFTALAATGAFGLTVVNTVGLATGTLAIGYRF